MNKKRGIFIVLFQTLILGNYFAQNQLEAKNVLLEESHSDLLQNWNIQYPSYTFHAVYKPYLFSTIKEYNDTVFPKQGHVKIKSNFLAKTLNDAPNKRIQYQPQILPLVHSIQGYDGKFVSENGIGSQVYLNVNNDFTCYLSGIVYNSSFPFFLDTAIRNTQIIRGIGLPLSANKNNYQYLYWNSYASYSKGFFNFQLGNGKMFVGNGYRSLLLSDISSPYPYLKLQANFWHMQYNVFYCLLKSYVPGSNIESIQNKYSTMHTLSWNITKKFNFTFFENVIWQGSDKYRNRGFDPNYLNPAVMLRPQEYSQGSPDNVMIGLNTSYIFSKKFFTYGQLALDEFYLKEIRAGKGWWGNKQAWQLGMKFLDCFGVQNLSLRVEYNEARPYTYSHGAVTQNYAHMGQPLAHPLGANFREFIGTINYSLNKWNIRLHQVYAEVGKDSLAANSNVGQNIFLTYTTHTKEYGNYTLQGVRTFMSHSQADFSYLIVPAMNMRLQLTVIYRTNTDVYYNLQNLYVGFGITCNHFNFYRDY